MPSSVSRREGFGVGSLYRAGVTGSLLYPQAAPGRDDALLRHPPLRTVRASFLAHGSSKLRCIFGHSFGFVDLLVTEEMY